MIVWTWTDDRPDAILRAIARAKARSWDNSDASRADFCALLAGTILLLGYQTGTVSYNDETATQTVNLVTLTFTSAEHEQIARALATTPCIFNPEKRTITQSIKTGYTPETGFGWPAAVAIVAAGVAVAAASAAWVATQAGPVLDRHLSRVEDGQRLLDSHAKLLEASAAHHAKEQAAGKTLPWDEAEKALLAELSAVQQKIQNKTETPLESPMGYGAILALGAVALGFLAYFGSKQT